MKRLFLVGTVGAVYLLHQDFWFWRNARPFLFGFLPIGLSYHLFYALLCSALMVLVVKLTWTEGDDPDR
jgi:hypothetical protein